MTATDRNSNPFAKCIVLSRGPPSPATERKDLEVSGGARLIEAGDQPPLPIDAKRAKQTPEWIWGLIATFAMTAAGSWLVLNRGMQGLRNSVRTFDAPLLDGLRLDACVQWAVQCGEEAESLWCKREG